MRLRITTAFNTAIALVLICFCSAGIQAAPLDAALGEVLIGYKADVRSLAVTQDHSTIGDVVGYHEKLHSQRMRLRKGVSIDAAIQALRHDPNVAYVEPNYVRHPCVMPNDPSFALQYHISRIAVDKAWEMWAPQAQVIVAVIDSGVDYTHPDLNGVLLRDISNNVISYNVITPNSPAIDDNGHGTHVAGIAVAKVNNGMGVAGVAGYGSGDYIRLMPLKAIDASGSGYDSGIATCIIWAVDHGAKVISLSLGGPSVSNTLENACNYAWTHNVLVVAAAGNEGSSALSYPGACSNVISVAASDQYDRLTSFSNYGSWVKAAAPGLQIYSTTRGGAYGYMSGTSMATPVVAGEAALIFAQKPNLSNADVSSIITTQVDPVTPYTTGHDLASGAGRINANLALIAAGYNSSGLISLVVTPSAIVSAATATGAITLGQNAPAGGLKINLSSNSPAVTVPQSVTVAAGAKTGTFTVTSRNVTVLTSVNITATNGSVSRTATMSITPVITPGKLILTIKPIAVIGGIKASGSMTLSNNAPAGGVSITLSSNSSCAVVPASITVPAGSSTVSFDIATIPVAAETSATITAAGDDINTTATLIVQKALLYTVTIDPSKLMSGGTTTGKVILNGTAPRGGITVTLASSNLKVLTPVSITVPAGANYAAFKVACGAVTENSPVTITATLSSVSKTAVVTVMPMLAALNIGSANAVSTNYVAGYVTLNFSAPTGGVKIVLSSSSAAASVPASVTVPAGAYAATFAVTSGLVTSAKQVTISATYGGVSKNISLNVSPLLASVTVDPVSIIGGSRAVGLVTLNGPAPTGGAVVTLVSAGAIKAPASVTVPAGVRSVSFTVTTTAVSTETSSTLTATCMSISKMARVTVKAPAPLSVKLSSSTVMGGKSVAGYVLLNASAPFGGMVVKLSSSSNCARVIVSVRVAAGATAAPFAITTSTVTANTAASISAACSGTTRAETLYVTP